MGSPTPEQEGAHGGDPTFHLLPLPDDGENLSLKPDALEENKRLHESAPRWAHALTPFYVLHHRLRRLLYIASSGDKRVPHAVANDLGSSRF